MEQSDQFIQGDLILILLLTESLTFIFFLIKGIVCVCVGGGGCCYKLQCKILQNVHDLPVYTIQCWILHGHICSYFFVKLKHNLPIFF